MYIVYHTLCGYEKANSIMYVAWTNYNVADDEMIYYIADVNVENYSRSPLMLIHYTTIRAVITT